MQKSERRRKQRAILMVFEGTKEERDKLQGELKEAEREKCEIMKKERDKLREELRKATE